MGMRRAQSEAVRIREMELSNDRIRMALDFISKPEILNPSLVVLSVMVPKQMAAAGLINKDQAGILTGAGVAMGCARMGASPWVSALLGIGASELSVGFGSGLIS